MPESHDPMCSVPLSYLTMLQERGDAEKQYTIAYTPGPDTKQAMEDGVTPQTYASMKDERDQAWERIAAFEERAGCKLEQIPVEALGDAQNAYVNQQAIDQLKRENESLHKRLNALMSQPAPEPARNAPAPYGLKKDGTPKKRPGRKVPRKRAA